MAGFTDVCDVCGLPDPYDGMGDGIGSCDCPRCECGSAAHSVLCSCPPDEDELYATLQAENLAAADIPADWPRGGA